MLNRTSVSIPKQYYLTTESARGSDTVYHLAFTDACEMVVVSRKSFEQPNKTDTVLYYEPRDFGSKMIDGRSLSELVRHKLKQVVDGMTS